MAQDATLEQIFASEAAIEEANLVGLTGVPDLKEAYTEIPGKIPANMYPCTVRWATDGDFGSETTSRATVTPAEHGSARRAILHRHKIMVVVGPRDTRDSVTPSAEKLAGIQALQRQAARWVDIVHRMYAKQETLGDIVAKAGLSGYRYTTLTLTDGVHWGVQFDMEVKTYVTVL